MPWVDVHLNGAIWTIAASRLLCNIVARFRNTIFSFFYFFFIFLLRKTDAGISQLEWYWTHLNFSGVAWKSFGRWLCKAGIESNGRLQPVVERSVKINCEAAQLLTVVRVTHITSAERREKCMMCFSSKLIVGPIRVGPRVVCDCITRTSLSFFRRNSSICKVAAHYRAPFCQCRVSGWKN